MPGMASCHKKSEKKLPVTDTYQASVVYHSYYHYGAGPIIRDTVYSTPFSTSELNDTLWVSYWTVNGAHYTLQLTEKRVYNQDSTLYYTWHPAPAASLKVYPAQHRIAYRWAFTTPRGDDQEYYTLSGQ